MINVFKIIINKKLIERVLWLIRETRHIKSNLSMTQTEWILEETSFKQPNGIIKGLAILYGDKILPNLAWNYWEKDLFNNKFITLIRAPVAFIMFWLLRSRYADTRIFCSSSVSDGGTRFIFSKVFLYNRKVLTKTYGLWIENSSTENHRFSNPLEWLEIIFSLCLSSMHRPTPQYGQKTTSTQYYIRDKFYLQM